MEGGGRPGALETIPCHTPGQRQSSPSSPSSLHRGTHPGRGLSTGDSTGGHLDCPKPSGSPQRPRGAMATATATSPTAGQGSAEDVARGNEVGSVGFAIALLTRFYVQKAGKMLSVLPPSRSAGNSEAQRRRSEGRGCAGQPMPPAPSHTGDTWDPAAPGASGDARCLGQPRAATAPGWAYLSVASVTLKGRYNFILPFYDFCNTSGEIKAQ